MKTVIERFNSINSLKINLEQEIKDTQSGIQEYSNILGEKIRSNEELSSDDPDFLALKAKLDGDSTDKKSGNKKLEKEPSEVETEEGETPEVETPEGEKVKTKDKSDKIKNKNEKKKKSKKGLSDKWFNLDEIVIYNGMGVKGELELYFKAVDELKSRLENLQRTLGVLNNVIEKGLKEDMGCIAFRGPEGILEISFLKSTGFRENFSLKSTYTGSAIPVNNVMKIGV